VQLDNLLHGGGQEQGRRGGTENVLLAVGLGAAAALATAELPELAAHQARLRARLERALLARLPAGLARVNGPAEESSRLPNTLSVGIRGLSSGSLLVQLKVRRPPPPLPWRPLALPPP
jgi:cysteine desulfurase